MNSFCMSVFLHQVFQSKRGKSSSFRYDFKCPYVISLNILVPCRWEFILSVVVGVRDIQ